MNIACLTLGNQAPIIGILTLPCSVMPHNCPPKYNTFNATTYIPASYVKWVEGGGGRVVPIRSDADHNEVRSLLSTLNGVVFTGGSAILNKTTSLYYKQVFNILSYLREYHDKYSNSKTQKAIPLWATCLGFEALVCATSQTGILIYVI